MLVKKKHINWSNRQRMKNNLEGKYSLFYSKVHVEETMIRVESRTKIGKKKTNTYKSYLSKISWVIKQTQQECTIFNQNTPYNQCTTNKARYSGPENYCHLITVNFNLFLIAQDWKWIGNQALTTKQKQWGVFALFFPGFKPTTAIIFVNQWECIYTGEQTNE